MPAQANADASVAPPAPAQPAAPTVAQPAATPAAFVAPTVVAATHGARTAAVEALVQLGKQRGQAAAKIALAPETLGGIAVTLTFGADGVTARLVAERPRGCRGAEPRRPGPA
ncbi:MAG: hypothetical protein PGN13_15035 [Patulibacter minatonensis]